MTVRKVRLLDLARNVVSKLGIGFSDVFLQYRRFYFLSFERIPQTLFWLHFKEGTSQRSSGEHQTFSRGLVNTWLS